MVIGQEQLYFVCGFASAVRSGELDGNCRGSLAIGLGAKNLPHGLAHHVSRCVSRKRATNLPAFRCSSIDRLITTEAGDNNHR